MDDEDSSGGSSPDRDSSEEITLCGWRGCGAQFASIPRLSAHVARAHAHPHQDGLFYCSWRDCMRPQRGFNARYKMLVHVRTHTNERPHTCTQCNKSFSRAENLKIHLRSHSGEKPYVCPYEGCGKAYSNSSDRFKHTRTHTVDKPYCCKVIGCNKRYTDPSSLRKHVKTYKHFTPRVTKDTHENNFLTEITREISPIRESDSFKPYAAEPTPPAAQNMHMHSPMRPQTYSVISDNPSTRIGSPIMYPPAPEQITYLKPLEPVIYPLRVPSYEMSYLEYTHMYEHAYRSYYTNSIPLTPPVYEKVYAYEDRIHYDVSMKERNYEIPDLRNRAQNISLESDMPLNLKRNDHQTSCRTESMMEDSREYQLMRCMDLPLDLSTKS